MNTYQTQWELALAIYGLKHGCANLDDCVLVVDELLDSLVVGNGINDLHLLLVDCSDDLVHNLWVAADDIKTLAVLCIGLLHKSGFNFAPMINAIRISNTTEANPMLKAATFFTLGVLGDPDAKAARRVAMRDTGYHSMEAYDGHAIAAILTYLAGRTPR